MRSFAIFATVSKNEEDLKMSENHFIIPNALQIVIDDLGWMNGRDDRAEGGPSRTGMPRRHCAQDYIAVNELGKALGMRINCAFVIGEWDPDNRLGRLPNFSKYGDRWDNAKYLDREELRRIVEVVNASEYIDLSIHGLMHGYYADFVDNKDASDFFYQENGVKYMIPEEELRARLDAFFGLLEYHGVKKEINSYVPSSALYIFDTMSKILAEYGVKYILQPFVHTDFGGEKPFLVTLENGIITTDRNHFIENHTSIDNVLPWDQCESDFLALPKSKCVIGSHFPNYLHRDPQRNGELTAAIASYVKSCADVFGSMMSRDLAFYSTQALYKRFARTEEKDGTFTVDISGVPNPVGNLGKFYISAKKPIKGCVGGEIRLYETKQTHRTYEVVPSAKILTFF